MQQPSAQFNRGISEATRWKDAEYASSSVLLCNWEMLRKQLLLQWTLITASELEITGPNCRRIALLVAFKYNITPAVVENYLRNFERTIPLL